MPKASRVLAALKRDGWIEIRRSGSHRTLEKEGGVARWAFHGGKDLGKVQIAQIARQLGYTRDELLELL
jgi:predicted RNA binding protein YcfA (HicA-like mRNA interferase family)